MDYYEKYLKYKTKYTKLKMKYQDNDYSSDNSDFDEMFKKDMHTNIMRLEFAHDLKMSNIKNKKFYDLVKNKELKILDDLPSNIEEYLKSQFINYNKSSLIDFFKSNPKVEDKKLDLSEYSIVFDNLTFKKSIINKLVKIFNITNYYQTFIGNAEQFLVSDKNEISKRFLNNENELLREYLIEAILIGFFPKSKNKLLTFSKYNNFTEYTDEFEKELKLLLEFILEVKDYKDIFTEKIHLRFIKRLIRAEKQIKKILNNDDNNSKGKIYKKKYRDKIEKLIFSMKEARDSYYIQEMINIQKENKNIIFITTDKILTFRCIFNNISVINILNGMIRYMAIYRDNKVKIIGNPFEIFGGPEEKLSSEKIKEIINDIINTPLMNLERTKIYYNKYLITTYNNLNKYSFYRDLDNTIDNYKKELPKAIEYIQTLFLMSDGIDTLQLLVSTLNNIKDNIMLDIEEDDEWCDLEDLQDKFETNISNYIDDCKKIKEKYKVKIEPLTFRILYINALIYTNSTTTEGFVDFIKLIKKILPDEKFNFEQITRIVFMDEDEECNKVLSNI
jgi:hypothetical protein